MLHRLVLILVCVLLLPALSLGADFYEDPHKGQEGWYGYQEYEENETAMGNNETTPALEWPSASEAMRMKPSELKKVLEKAADVAIGNPTEKNVLRWVRYIEIASRKSLEFANVVAWVREQHPELDAMVQDPFTHSAQGTAAKIRWFHKKNLLDSSRDKFAILLFVSRDIPLSSVAEKIVRQFARAHHWEYKVVDVNDVPQLAYAVGVNAIPQAWVISREGYDSFVAMTGAVTVSELETSIYRGIRLVTGEITPRNYAGKVPVVETKNDLEETR